MRAPLAPMGWPRATAPPLTLILSGFELQFARDGDGLHGEGFVQLDQVDVFIAIPTRFLEQFFDGLHGRHHHPFRLDAADGLRDDARDRLFAEALRVAFAGDDDGRGAVVCAGGITCGDGAVFLECGAEFAEGFERSVFARRFVFADDDGRAFFLRNFDGHDLRFEEAGFHGADGFLMAFERILILLGARNFIFFGDEFGGDAHVVVLVGFPEAVVNHRVNQLAVAETVAGARLHQTDTGNSTWTPCRRRRACRIRR